MKMEMKAMMTMKKTIHEHRGRAAARAVLRAAACAALSLGLGACASTPKDDVWSLLDRGEGDKARAFFTGSVDVNAVDGQGRTPLHLAAEHGDAALAQFFIALGARTEAEDGQGRTPLDISAARRDPATARVLAAAGADIHHAPGKGDQKSPAEIAVGGGGADQRLLTGFLEPGTVNRAGGAANKTLLHLAAEAGNIEAVRLILEVENVQKSPRDAGGETPLGSAFRHTDSRDHAAVAALIVRAGGEAAPDSDLDRYFSTPARTGNWDLRGGDGMALLHYLAREGFVGYLGYVLEQRVDVNAKNASGATPLHEAARSGRLPVMRLLLDHKADVNAQDGKGNSVLHIAAPGAAAQDALELFLSWGADPNLRDERGDSPLHVAVTLRRPARFVETLVAAKADTGIRNKDGKTALYLAVEAGRAELVPALLAGGADVFAADNDGFTPLERALLDGSPALMALLTPETALQSDREGNTPLHAAVASRRATPALIAHILNQGARVDARNKDGDTPLLMAALMNDQESGALLLAHDADIFAANTAGDSPLLLAFPPEGTTESALRRWMLTEKTLALRDGLGNTPLHYTAQWGFDDWIPYLVHAGAATEAANATGETPMHTAVKRNAAETIEVLAGQGARVDARDSLGRTPLHAAVRWNAQAAAEALIARGADVNAHSQDGRTPLHDAVRLGQTGIETLLVTRGADLEARDALGNTPFMEAMAAEFPLTMERLAARGADTAPRNLAGDTPLHLAVRGNRPDIALRLLDWGGSIHARNAAGSTPLEEALGSAVASSSMVGIFLDGARLNAPDDVGRTPLAVAVGMGCPVTTINGILALGRAQISTLDAEGRTPLRTAVEARSWDVARLLVERGADVFFPGSDGKSPASLALGLGEDAVRALFSGPALNARDRAGNTILHYAAQAGDTAIITLLIGMGADRAVRNGSAESPADLARVRGHPDAAALLARLN